MDRIINNIQFTWMIWILRTYRTCNSIVWYSKYEFYNWLLSGVMLLKITSGITWIQLSLSLSLSLSLTNFHLRLNWSNLTTIAPKGYYKLQTLTKSKQCLNLSNGTGFVNISSTFSKVWNFSRTMSLVTINSLIWWNLTSISFAK